MRPCRLTATNSMEYACSQDSVPISTSHHSSLSLESRHNRRIFSSMEPVAAFSVVAGSITLVRLLGQNVLSVKTILRDIKNIVDSTQGFGEELGAFEFALTMLDSELRKGTMNSEIQEWWNPTRLDDLLSNATKTFSRLAAIFNEINRQRGLMHNIRQYYRTSRSDDEIRHLRLRIITYTGALNIPVILSAM
jgi:hypothetical protein